MKRSILILCICIFCFFEFCGIAEGTIDFSSMTIEELLSLQKKIGEELIKKNRKEFVEISSGNYVAGQDIASGKYKLCIYEIDEGYVEIAVYQKGQTAESFDYAEREASLLAYDYRNSIKEGKTVEIPEPLDRGKYIVREKETYFDSTHIYITLEEGQTLSLNIRNGMVVAIEQAKGLFMED